MNLVRWTALAGLLLLVGTAQAGSIHPALQAEMDRTAQDIPISVIVHMSEQAPIAEMNRDLKIQMASRQERHRQVVLALQQASESQEDFRDYLDARMVAGGVDGYTSYWISNLAVVLATKDEIEQIAARYDVDRVERNFSFGLIEPIATGVPDMRGEADEGGTRENIGVTNALRAIRAPEVWYQLGYTGQGRLVANCDTGVMGGHDALSTRWRGYNGQHPWDECWLDVLGTGTQFPTDTHGHGTHVMGTETGLGRATIDTIGVAWEAQWIASNAINQSVGSGFDNDIITCYQWYADPDGNPNTVDDVPDVVQNSWRINENFGGDYTDCDDRWWDVIDHAEAAGVVSTWSAGNEGPGGTSIGSPADRATTATNVLSVGSVNATDYGWPYPISSFSSRGPTGCNVPAELLIKPEVVAPGENVYSSTNDGHYQGGWNGTSMSGPHVAGVVGLMREANPNLDVDTIKQILMDTARDEGTPGEDNVYGWGFIDAFAAVIGATVGFGEIEGVVRNSSWLNAPIEGARVKLIELGNQYSTNGLGYYHGSAPAGDHFIEASHPSFRPDTAYVTIVSNEVTVQNFSLEDIAGPTITDVSEPLTTTDTAGPYTIDATVEDFSTVVDVKLYYRLNGGGWVEAAMSPLAADYTADIPGMPAGTRIDYYVWAEDGIGLESTYPANAPSGFLSLFITEVTYAYDAEADDPGWTIGDPNDTATSGVWERVDPEGTLYNGNPVQPEDDHTPDPGVLCFVTDGTAGAAPGDYDVDDGCTTLLSPIFDFSGVEFAFVSYHRWFGQTGFTVDDDFAVDVSPNGGGSWIPLERVSGDDSTWRKVTYNVGDFIILSNQVQFRFVACDLGGGGLVEAGIDDFSVETFTQGASDVPGQSGIRLRTRLAQNEPNPFNPVTAIRFTLSNPGAVRLEIYDASGRMLRVLVDEEMQAGTHQALWDGRDDDGHSVGSGVYFYRLKAGVFEQSKRMTILK